MSRSVSWRVSEEDRPRFITEAVGVVARSQVTRRRTLNVKGLVSYAVNNDFHLMTSDKEGFFVVAPETAFSQKAMQAVTKNFVPVDVKPQKVKKRALALLQEHNLEKLATAVKKSENLNLQIF